MATLKTVLTQAGFEGVGSYINSGNILLSSDLSPDDVTRAVQAVITKSFELDSDLIKVLTLTRTGLQDIVDQAPNGFGSQPGVYKSDVAFMIDMPAEELMKVISPNPAVDTVWQGQSAVYYQRLSSDLTKSRMSKIVGTKVYKSITIRNWNTVTNLLALLEK